MTSYWEVQCELAYPENTILVNAFLLSEKATRSKRVLANTRSVLQRFFLTQTKHFADITEKEIRQWLREQEKTLTEKTRGQYLSYIRQLYNYAVLEKHMEESPLYPKKNGLKAYWLLDMEWVVPENAERVAGFLLHQKGRNICKSTILRQRSILQRFFVHQTKDLIDIMKEDIEQWITEQKIHHNIVAVDFFKILNIFLNYAVLEQYIEISPLHAKDKPVTSHERYYELKLLLPNPENQSTINQFLYSLKETERKKSTIVSIRVCLQHFFKDIEKPFHSITLDEIEQRLRESPDKQKEQKRSALRSFYEYCMEKGITNDPPLRRKVIYNYSSERYWEVLLRLPNEENKAIINDFLLNLHHKKRGRRTITGYKAVLQLFFFKTDVHFSQLTPEDIESWFNETQGNVTTKTIQNYMCVLRCFYNYCYIKDYMNEPLLKTKWEIERDKEKYWEARKPIKSPENLEMMNEYLLNMKIANMSRGTIILHKNILRMFFRDREETFSLLASADILGWVVHLQMKLKSTTVKNCLSTLSSFFTFCVEEGYLEKSPIKSRWFPRLPKPLPKYLEKVEVAKIRQVSEKESLRDRGLVEFFLSSGCRIGEIHLLDKSDIDLENRSAIVTGKGKKIRRIHFSETCAILVERYFETCQYEEHPAAFLTKAGSRLSKSQIYAIVRRMGEEAGIVGTLHPHRFRHTFATDLITKGASLSFIADELGHSSLETTQLYARLPKWKLIKLYRMYMG